MNKTILIFVLIMASLISGCSNSARKNGISSTIYNESKEIYLILADYMQKGNDLNSSKQRKIDNYISKAKLNLDKYNEQERVLVESVLTINSLRGNYEILQKSDDKLLQMDAFNKNANRLKEFFAN